MRPRKFRTQNANAEVRKLRPFLHSSFCIRILRSKFPCSCAMTELMNSRGNLAGWISNAPAIKPGVLMPPNVMASSELEDLLAYLETLK